MSNLSKEFDGKINSASNIMDKPTSFGAALEKATHSVGSEIGEAYNGVAKQTSAYVRSTRDYVEAHPIQSIAIATASGLALGGLLATLMRRRS